MALITGMKTSYNDLVGLKLDLSEVVESISPLETPILSQFGTGLVVVQKKHEWLEKTLNSHKDILAEAIVDNGADKTVVATDSTKFIVGDVILIDSEQMRVTAVNTSTHVLTVTRPFAGSSGATHLINAPIEIISSAIVEGADTAATDARSGTRASKYNLCQIFKKVVSCSGTQSVIPKYGEPDPYQVDVADATKLVAILLEKAAIYGLRYDDTSTLRTFGGLNHYITTNVTDKSAAALEEGFITTMLQTLWDAGGNPGILMVNGYQRRVINSFQADRIRIDRDDTVRGAIVDTYDSPFHGRLKVMLNRYCPADRVYFLSPEYIKIGALSERAFALEVMAKTGDSILSHVLGEYTMEVKCETAHGILTGLATS